MAASREWLEDALVGAVMRDATLVDACGLEPEHFAGKLHRELWTAVLRLTGLGKPVDAVTVADDIARETGHDVMSEAARLVMDTVAASGSLPAYADRLREIDAETRARRVTDGILRGTMSVAEGSERLSQIVTETAPSGKGITAYLAELIDWLESDDAPGVPTGIADLDAKTGGLHAGDLVVLAARPAMGKTAFAANIMRHAANQRKAVGMISGEQPGREIAGRLATMQAGVTFERLRAKDLSDDDWSRLHTAFASLKHQRVMIADKAMPDVADVCRMARRWHGMRQLDVLVVDYLQLIQGGQGDSFRLQVGDVTNRLKALARDLSIPVLLLAQVKREVEQRQMGKDNMGRMPWMADIAESAIIEQVADQIITLYRPSVYTDEVDETAAYLNIAKNRHGRTGVLQVHWDGASMRFGDRARATYSGYSA